MCVLHKSMKPYILKSKLSKIIRGSLTATQSINICGFFCEKKIVEVLYDQSMGILLIFKHLKCFLEINYDE